MVSHVMRNLRRQKLKNEKSKKQTEPQPCIITVKELHEMFPTLTEGVIRSRLKDRCSCIAYKVSYESIPSYCFGRQQAKNAQWSASLAHFRITTFNLEPWKLRF